MTEKKKSRLIKNYIYNTAYQILVLIVPLITTPYISRVLGANNIGIYGYTESIAAYFVLLSAVGTNLYGQREIAYCQDDTLKRTATFWEIVIFRVLMTLACTSVFLLLFCRSGEYSSIFRLLTIEVVANAFDISWLYMGVENFKTIVLRNTSIKVIGTICIFIFVRNIDDLYAYVICLCLPMLIGNLLLWLNINKYIVRVRTSLSELLEGLKSRIRPILMLFIPQIAMEVYVVLDKTMLGVLGTNMEQVGYYTQAQKVVKIILTIVTSLGTVMLPAMSVYFASGEKEKITSSIKTALRFIFMLSSALTFGLCAISDYFVPLFFGEGYDPVVSLIMVISPILIIIGTSNVFGKQYLLPTNQQNPFTISIVAGALVNLIMNLLLIPRFQAVGASVATVIAELTVTIVQCYYVRNQIEVYKEIIPLIKYLCIGALMFCLIKFIKPLLPCSWGSIIILIIVGVIIYFVLLLMTKDKLFLTGKELVHSRLRRK